jgi:hypothetical protein
MKKLIVFILFMAFVVGLPTVVIGKDGKFENVSEWCTSKNDLGFGKHGTCVSFVNACNGPGEIGSEIVCKELLDYSPEVFYTEYGNLTECVNHLSNGYVFE